MFATTPCAAARGGLRAWCDATPLLRSYYVVTCVPCSTWARDRPPRHMHSLIPSTPRRGANPSLQQGRHGLARPHERPRLTIRPRDDPACRRGSRSVLPADAHRPVQAARPALTVGRCPLRARSSHDGLAAVRAAHRVLARGPGKRRERRVALERTPGSGRGPRRRRPLRPHGASAAAVLGGRGSLRPRAAGLTCCTTTRRSARGVPGARARGGSTTRGHRRPHHVTA
jgi:hypothetical protein